MAGATAPRGDEDAPLICGTEGTEQTALPW